MKIKEIKAYQSEDGCIWETIEDAIEQNISDSLSKIGYEYNDTYTETMFKLKHWIKNYPNEVKYIINNINKIK